MKVSEVIKKLQQENPDEEVVMVINRDTSTYYTLLADHFLHAGPSRFVDKDGNEFSKSVVIIRVEPQHLDKKMPPADH